ncbi:hypothetical protein CYLTODRAFT_447095 [Cylindrobasidium torrendii FP15055 ss-10]|uniref:Uncharacterized protein n=1 Tax=Cylindrobasidium torrendii FP15055 ss-10 TaxID=1314674 RepID=A0A0D7AXL3_9AGAR|nr:hypothetical protein CYLTODRAFT_447095 [Cylindrobasidium torrendii FP15055 ss-10]
MQSRAAVRVLLNCLLVALEASPEKKMEQASTGVLLCDGRPQQAATFQWAFCMALEGIICAPHSAGISRPHKYQLTSNAQYPPKLPVQDPTANLGLPSPCDIGKIAYMHMKTHSTNTPPTKYSSSTEQQPDYNLTVKAIINGCLQVAVAPHSLGRGLCHSHGGRGTGGHIGAVLLFLAST